MLGNLYAVAISTDSNTIHIIRLGLILSRSDSLNLAAWIATLADPTGEEFSKLLKEARSD